MRLLTGILGVSSESNIKIFRYLSLPKYVGLFDSADEFIHDKRAINRVEIYLKNESEVENVNGSDS